MRPLKELINIDTRFRKSVNLQLDLGDYEKAREYIPTKSSIKILKEYLKNVQGEISGNANILIGPYGKGKSHLLLVLLAVLKGEHSKLKNLLEDIYKIDRETAERIMALWQKKKPFLPVLVSTTGNDLKFSLIQALRESLLREGLDALAPDSYYSEAEKTIQMWEKCYPDTYLRWKELIKEQGYTHASFIEELKNYNKNTLQLFQELYPQLTAGSIFQPMLQQEAGTLYKEVNRKLCKEYGYSGIYIIFDEFSKYIEGHTEENFGNDMKTLQEICDLANNSQKNKNKESMQSENDNHSKQSETSENVIQRDYSKQMETSENVIQRDYSKQSETSENVIQSNSSKRIENSKDSIQNENVNYMKEDELVNDSEEEMVFITLVAHKSIHEYEKNIPKSVKDNFKGVEGRLKEVRFVVSAQNNYELIADTIKKKEPDFSEELQERMKDSHMHSVIEESFELPCFHSLFEKEDYQQVMVRGCFPLLPLCAYSVLHLSEKVAQNERTIFTFLTNDEPGSLVRILKKGADNLIGIDAVYDYFKSLFRESADMPQIHNEWLKADYALDLAENESEKKIIKALAVIRMIHREDELPAQDKSIRLSVGLSQEEYEKAMESLKNRGIILYRSSLGMYSFKNKVGVDIEGEIKKEISSISKGFQLCERLAEISDLEYILPRKYNQEYAMTRYFSYEYMTPETFLKLEQGNYLFEKKNADGKIIALVSETDIDIEKIKEHIKQLQEERMIVIIPKVLFRQTENVKRLIAIGALMENEGFLEENKVLLQELKLYQEDLSFEINVALEESFLPEHRKSVVVYLEEEKSQLTANTFNVFLSDILEKYYEHTPRINHELLNIQNVTGQYLRARNQVVDTILENKDCSKYLKGTNPESMIYRAAFVKTGILENDQKEKVDKGCSEILQEIENYFVRCIGEKQPFSILYEKLQGKTYGVRRGIVPLFIAMKLASSEDTAVIYLGKKELAINAEVLNHVNESPEKYQLYIEEESGRKEQYLAALEKIFCENEGKIFTKQVRLRRIADEMQGWYRGLPQYAMVTLHLPQEHLEAVKLVRNYLKRAEMNPRELLLECLPQGLAQGDLEQTIEILQIVYMELTQAIDKLQEEIVVEVKHIFSAKEQESLKGCLKAWYEQYGIKAHDHIFSSVGNHFMHYLENFSVNSEKKIIEELSRKVLDIYFEDWNDGTKEEFFQSLQQVKEEIEKVAKKDATESGRYQIIVTDASSNKEYLKKSYDIEEDDSTADFLKNMINETLEEFGDTLETNQKVAVLIQAIKELLPH